MVTVVMQAGYRVDLASLTPSGRLGFSFFWGLTVALWFLSSSGSTSAAMPSTQAPPAATTIEVTPGVDPEEEPVPAGDPALNSAELSTQMKDEETTFGSGSETTVDLKTLDSSTMPTSAGNSVHSSTSSQLQQGDSSQSTSTDPCELKELQEGQEIYIQTEGLTVQMAEPGLDRIVIVNGPDGTTMHIQTPEGVPLEAVQALLGIEASDGANPPQWTLTWTWTCKVL